MGKRCYFCLDKDSLDTAIDFKGSNVVCSSCVSILKTRRSEDEKYWLSIVKMSDNPKKFQAEFDEKTGKNKVEDLTKLDSSELLKKMTERWENHRDERTQTDTSSSQEQKSSPKDLGKILKQRVMNQDHVINSIVPKILIQNLGIKKTKPLSFLFAGPTGVGKTELSEAISSCLNIPLVKINMSEYKEKHAVSKLTGAPPGYVGYDSPSPFEKVNGKKGVILLDEVEKAHPEIFDLFLQVLDKGELSTGKNKPINLKETIVIMTSNLGVRESSFVRPSVGLIQVEQKKVDPFNEAIRNFFRPEFVNRLDAIYTFDSLKEESLDAILNKHLNILNEELNQAHGVEIVLKPSLRQEILSKGYSPADGARYLLRILNQYVMEFVAQKVLIEEQTDQVFELSFENGSVIAA